MAGGSRGPGQPSLPAPVPLRADSDGGSTAALGWEPWMEASLGPPPHDPSPRCHRCRAGMHGSNRLPRALSAVLSPAAHALGSSGASGAEKYVVGSTWRGPGRNGGCWWGALHLGARKSLSTLTSSLLVPTPSLPGRPISP